MRHGTGGVAREDQRTRGAATGGIYYQQLDVLRLLRQEVRRDLLEEAKNTRPGNCSADSGDRSDSSRRVDGLMQTPHRFRTKRQLWTYSGLGIETCSSADHVPEDSCNDPRKTRFVG